MLEHNSKIFIAKSCSKHKKIKNQIEIKQIVYMAKTTTRHLLPHTHTYQKSIYANNKCV